LRKVISSLRSRDSGALAHGSHEASAEGGSPIFAVIHGLTSS
jgi:hypothetical protein